MIFDFNEAIADELLTIARQGRFDSLEPKLLEIKQIIAFVTSNPNLFSDMKFKMNIKKDIDMLKNTLLTMANLEQVGVTKQQKAENLFTLAKEIKAFKDKYSGVLS